MADIPSQLSFEHMLAHLFPGFFTALSVFMILDILSPLNISQMVLKDTNGMIGFLGFIILVGTILGVIIDGFHHRVIELKYFSNKDNIIPDRKDGKLIRIKSERIVSHIRSQLKCNDGKSEKCSNCIFNENYSYELLKIYYAFDMDNMDKCIALHDYLRKTVYHYYEFYANTFIAMIPFTFIAPIYMVKILYIDYSYASAMGVGLLFLTIACIDFAWMAYERWISVLYFSFCRCLDGRTLGENKEGHSIELTWR